MSIVAQIETFLDRETVTLFKLEDLQNIIIDNLGYDVWRAIEYFVNEKAEKKEDEGPSIITYVEDGIFTDQVRESDLVKKIVENIISDLQEQDYLKKNKNTKNFKYAEDEIIELIDQELTPGMMNYFEK